MLWGEVCLFIIPVNYNICFFIKLQQNPEKCWFCVSQRHSFHTLFLISVQKIPFYHSVCAYVVCVECVIYTNTPGPLQKYRQFTVPTIFSVANGVSSCPWWREARDNNWLAAGLSSEDIFRNTLLLSTWPRWKTMRNTDEYLHYFHHIRI